MKRALLLILITLSINIFPEKLTIAVTSTELTLNPFYTYTAREAQYLTGIYEGLVSYHPQNLSPQPALAESWDLSEDKRVYTFKIRKDAKFSSGEKITADTFVKTFLKLLHPDTKAEFASLLDIIEGAQEFRIGNNSDPSSVKIKSLDKERLEITLKKRAPYFTKILCHHSFSPLPDKLLHKREWTKEDLISSGPYLLSIEEEKLIYSRNPKYWDEVGYDTIEVVTYDNAQEATKAFNQGDVDWIQSIVDFNTLSDKDSFLLTQTFGTTYYYFNPNYKEYRDSEIRKAISLLIPWNNIRENQFIPADSLIPSMENFPKNRIKNSYNPEEGLKILNKKGFPEGKNLSDLIVSIPGNTQFDREVANIIKSAIEEKTEIKVIIKTTPYPDFFTVNRGSDFSISTLSWIGDFADPLTFLDMWTTNSNLNDSKYNNPEYDEIIDNSSNLEKKERYRELSKAEKILLEQTIVIPIGHTPELNVINTDFVREWYSNVLDIHPFKYLKPGFILKIEGLI